MRLGADSPWMEVAIEGTHIVEGSTETV